MIDIIRSLQNQTVNMKFGNSFREDPVFGFLTKLIKGKKLFSNKSADDVIYTVRDYQKELVTSDIKLLISLLKKRKEEAVLRVN